MFNFVLKCLFFLALSASDYYFTARLQELDSLDELNVIARGCGNLGIYKVVVTLFALGVMSLIFKLNSKTGTKVMNFALLVNLLLLAYHIFLWRI